MPPGTAPPLHTPPRLCATPLRAAPPSDTTAPRRRRRCRTGRSSLAREPTRHRGALAKGRWSDHPAGACQKAWPQRTLDRADLRREKRQCWLRGGGTARGQRCERTACERKAGVTGGVGRRSAAASGALAEPARATAAWRRLRPSDTAACSAAGPGKDWQRPWTLSPPAVQRVGVGARRRTPTNISRLPDSSSEKPIIPFAV